MSKAITPAAEFYSEFGADPDMAELVEMFVEDLPQRVESLRHSISTSDWNELARTSHQLKGASGSYGFHQLTPFAARLEHAVREQAQEEEINRLLEDLIQICAKLRSGTPT